MENLSLAQIRQLLDETFSDEEIEVLCFDHFTEVYNGFAVGMTKVQKLLRLLSYCQSRDLISNLVVLLNRERPGLIERKFPSLLQTIKQDRSVDEDLESDTADDEGYLDAVELFEDYFESAVISLGRMTEAVQDVSTFLRSGTTRLTELQTSGNPVSARELKRAVNRTAYDLETFATRIEAEVPIFPGAFQNGIRAQNKAITLLADFGENTEERIVRVRSSLQLLETSIDSSDMPTMAFRNSIANSPRITTAFNKARRRAVAALDSYLSELAKNKTMVRDAQSLLNGLSNTEP